MQSTTHQVPRESDAPLKQFSVTVKCKYETHLYSGLFKFPEDADADARQKFPDAIAVRVAMRRKPYPATV